MPKQTREQELEETIKTLLTGVKDILKDVHSQGAWVRLNTYAKCAETTIEGPKVKAARAFIIADDVVAATQTRLDIARNEAEVALSKRAVTIDALVPYISERYHAVPYRTLAQNIIDLAATENGE